MIVRRKIQNSAVQFTSCKSKVNMVVAMNQVRQTVCTSCHTFRYSQHVIMAIISVCAYALAALRRFMFPGTARHVCVMALGTTTSCSTADKLPKLPAVLCSTLHDAWQQMTMKAIAPRFELENQAPCEPCATSCTRPAKGCVALSKRGGQSATSADSQSSGWAGYAHFV